MGATFHAGVVRRWGALGFLVVMAFAAAPANAAPAYEIKLAADIDPGPGSGADAFNGGAVLGGSMVFTGTTPGAGDEPWISDGTPEGTRMLKDINPGAADSTSVSNYVTFEGRTFFSATDPVNGTELWATDGTSAGTELVKDFRPGASSSFPDLVGAFRGKLFVVATSDATGREFWTVDPDLTITLSAETVAGAGSVEPQRAQLAGDYIYFTGSNAAGRSRGRRPASPRARSPTSGPGQPAVTRETSCSLTASPSSSPTTAAGPGFRSSEPRASERRRSRMVRP